MKKQRDEFYIQELWPKAFYRVDNGIRSMLSWKRWLEQHPGYMHSEGTMIYCGRQGAGKTLSAVRYLMALMERYPKAVVCTNVGLTYFPFNAAVSTEAASGWAYTVETDARPIVEYSGLDCLKWINNGYQGVIYLIDELHLELNSLESKNIDIEVMVEISQQRKQRKHIIGTSQQYLRLAKPLREQVHDIVLCKCLLDRFQLNKWIDGTTAVEENGQVVAQVKKTSMFWHTPAMYHSYDTYAKMKRYNDEWQGRKRQETIYSPDGGVQIRGKGRVRA